MAIFDVESGKYAKLPKAFVIENGKYVALKKAFVVEGGKYVKLWSSSSGIFLVGGYNSTLLKSEDGVTWERMSPTINSSDGFFKLAYGNGILVGLVYGDIYYSTDKGNTWVSTGVNVAPYQSSTSTSAIGSGLAFGNGRFVVVSGSTGYNKGTFYSTDGKNWTKFDSTYSAPRPSCRVYDVKYVGNKFFAYTVDTDKSEDVWVSDDGITWTDISNKNSYSGATTWVEYAFGKYYLNTSGYVHYSTNGTTWTTISSGATSAGSLCASASEDIIAIVGATSIGNNKNIWTHYITSDNAIKGTSGLLTNTVYDASAFTSMVYKDKFVVVGANSQIGYSNDGKTWTQLTALDTAVNLVNICFIPED